MKWYIILGLVLLAAIWLAIKLKAFIVWGVVAGIIALFFFRKPLVELFHRIITGRKLE